MASCNKVSDRRQFLNFLAASPILAYAGIASGLVHELLSRPLEAQEMSLAPKDAVVIKSVKEALTVMDFDAAARAKLPIAHYEFITDGSFYDETVKANRAGFQKYEIRMRRLTGVNKVDQSVRIFGVNWESAIFLCPVGRMNAYYPHGAATVARAAKAQHTLQILSAAEGVHGLEEVNAARGEPVWVAWSGKAPDPATVRQIEGAGCPVLVWTVDTVAGANTIGAKSIQRAGVADLNREADSRCSGCHASMPSPRRTLATDPMDIIGAVGGLPESNPRPTWDDVKRVKDTTKMKLVLKGIVCGDDAALAVQHGADAIIVSNHGGHEDASGRGTIECLPEVMAGAGGRIPVLIDGGFRSGADAYKALALGATAVGVGRPHIWGLSSFGQDGVETVIEILRRELQVMMAQTDATSIGKISRESLVTRT
jgi:4-hydroxymandelate oxidase